MTMRRKLKLFGLAVLIIIVAICFGIVNKYLSGNHLLIYATGTNDKAFLNATWKMSPQEIERANKTSLSKSITWFLAAPQVTDNSRLKSFIQENLSLWGNNSKVEYFFLMKCFMNII